MTGFLRQRPIVSGIVALFVLVLLLTAFPIVPETKQAVIVRFGKPERILNQYNPNKPIGSAGCPDLYQQRQCLFASAAPESSGRSDRVRQGL